MKINRKFQFTAAILVAAILMPVVSSARWISVDPKADQYPSVSPYVYALNNPIKNTDPDGQAVETVVDVISVGLSAADLYNDPSWGNAGFLALDVVGALVPFVPAVGVFRHAGKIGDLLGGADKLIDAGKGIDKASDVKKAGIYEFKTTNGKTYVGESKRIPSRLNEHVQSGKTTAKNASEAKTTTVGGGKTARVIAEQKRINQLGGVKNLENIRNPIGKKRQHLIDNSKPRE